VSDVSRELGRPAIAWVRTPWPLVLVLVISFVLLGIAARQTDAFQLDVRFTRWLQGLDWAPLRWGTDLTKWSMNGVPLTLGAIAVLLIFLFQGWRIDAMMLAVVIVVRLVNSGMKVLIASPRPTADLVEGAGESDTYGFPSGHASGALLVVGAIAWIISRHVTSPAWRAAIWVIATCWIVLTGIGRVYVGAHWPSDVVGAWLWSIAAMVVITWGTEKVRTREVAESRGAR
jgi:membrane-associated phospholipid phosphatase